RKLAARRTQCVIMDSDELRRVLTPSPTYTPEERDWFYDALGQLAAWLTSSGVNVLIAATAHRRAYRDSARSRIARFAEVHVQCSESECRRRDPKGLYARSATGGAETLPGAGVAYEPPLRPDATVSTEGLTPDQAAEALLSQL